MTFRGDEVRRLRTYEGWSTAELAIRSGLTRQAILAIERGGVEPRNGNAKAIADALGVELSTLYEDDPK